MLADQTRPTPTRLARLGGAVLCLAVAVIHVIDQGGIPGSKTPTYVGVGYYALEIIGVVTAGLLVVSIVRAGRFLAAAWFLAAGVAVGPFIGYVLSRGPVCPGTPTTSATGLSRWDWSAWGWKPSCSSSR
jgi:hypothetical protein